MPATRRLLQIFEVVMDVEATDPSQAMTVSNQLNSVSWKTSFETSLKALVGFSQVSITIDQSELHRADCTIVSHQGLVGNVFTQGGLPLINTFDTVVECLMLCVKHAHCMAYQYKEN